MAPVLGALFAILVGILAIHPYLVYQQQSFENVEAANTASQFRQLINAVQLYVQNNCLPTVDGNTGEITPPSTCPVDQSLSGSNYYVVLVDKNLLSTLQSNGYLPQGTAATNPYHQGWSIVVSSVASSSNGTIQALLYSTEGQPIPERLAPEIAAETGQEGGFVPYPNQYGRTVSNNLAQGAYGHWSTTFPNTSPGKGHLVALLDVGQNGVNDDDSGDYLYRRAVPGDTEHKLNTMQTDLNMKGNNVSDANLVSANEVETGTPQTVQGEALGNNAVMSTTGSTSKVVTNQGTASSSFNNTMQFSSNAGAGLSIQSYQYQFSPAVIEIATQNNGMADMIMEGPKGTSVGIVSSQGPSLFEMEGGQSTTFDLGNADGASINQASPASTVNIESSGTSTLNVTGNTGSTLTVGTQGATTGLVISAVAENAGDSCTQLGTIAPDAGGSGMPLVCSQASSASSPVWTSMGGGGGDFTKSQMLADVAAGSSVAVSNNRQKPEFLSTDCTTIFLNGDKFYLSITVFNASGQLISTNSSRQYIEGAGGDWGGRYGTHASSSPYVSAMVPPEGSATFQITTENNLNSTAGDCELYATY